MGEKPLMDSVSELFPIDEESPTFPNRSRSGGTIKARVVRAMHEQLAALRDANAKADAWLHTLARFTDHRRIATK